MKWSHLLQNLNPRKREALFQHVYQLQNYRQVLLLSCCAKIVGHDGSTTQARALLNSASSASFIAEYLAQPICLVHRNHSVNISGISATSNQSSSLRVISIAHADKNMKIVPLEALILSKILSPLSLHPVSLDSEWKHLDSTQLANPDFSTPGNVDLLLGADSFSCVVFHGRWFGPWGSLSTFKTQFAWVLAGAIYIEHHLQGSTNLCYCSIITEENLRVDVILKKFL